MYFLLNTISERERLKQEGQNSRLRTEQYCVTCVVTIRSYDTETKLGFNKIFIVLNKVCLLKKDLRSCGPCNTYQLNLIDSTIPNLRGVV